MKKCETTLWEDGDRVELKGKTGTVVGTEILVHVAWDDKTAPDTHDDTIPSMFITTSVPRPFEAGDLVVGTQRSGLALGRYVREVVYVRRSQTGDQIVVDSPVMPNPAVCSAGAYRFANEKEITAYWQWKNHLNAK